MSVGSSGVSALYWKEPVTAGDTAIWDSPGVLGDGGGPPASGTVTSVGLALPASVFTVSGSPVTTSGTLTGSFAAQTANTVFAGPATAPAAVPTFRALVAADLPTLNLVVGTTTIGSGTTTRILYDNAGVLGEYTLTGSGTVVAMQTSPAFTTPAIGVATGTSLRLGAVSTTTGQLFLANSASANLTTLQAGNATNARTYTWPVDFGAAGTVLTDAAGNGTLSWASPVSSTAVTAAAIMTTNQLVVGDDGARGVKTANATITGNLTWSGTQNFGAAVTVSAGGLFFSTTNTLDIGTSATVLAPRTVYAGTSFVGPVGTFTTSVTVGAGSALTSTGAGGALTALAFTTPGTGVATALAVNIGTAGSFVVNGGALGSPSSAGTIPAFTLGGTIAGGGNQLNNIIIGTSTPLAGAFTTITGTKGTITAGTLADQAQAFSLTATQPTTITNTQAAVLLTFTSAGSSAQSNYGLEVDYNAGYSGNRDTAAISISNSALGTGAMDPFSGSSATFSNSGFNMFLAGSGAGTKIGGLSRVRASTGINVGFYGISDSPGSGSTSYGIFGKAAGSSGSNNNIGVAGIATAGGNTGVGVFAGLMAAAPTWASAALLADNGAVAADIFSARDNGTVVFTIADGGAVSGSGSHTFTVASAGIILKQGANGRVGTFVANGTTPVTVNNTSIAITDAIIISVNAVGGTGPVVEPFVTTITAATSFTVTAGVGDTSTYNYAIIKNAA